MSRRRGWEVGDVVKASRFKCGGRFHDNVWLLVEQIDRTCGGAVGVWCYVSLLVDHPTALPFNMLSYDEHDVGRRVPPSRWPPEVCKAMALRQLVA